MNGLRLLNWTETNQQFMVAEFTRLKALLKGEDPSEALAAIDQVQAALPSPSAIDGLVECFGLSSFERDVLLLCAGVEMDSELATLCGTCHHNANREYASFGLALAVLKESHWSALTPLRP
uniref:hypothetical protein n=1 Tax=Crenothrix polyspora TaxID=360316 RepID=UPI001C4FF90F